MIKSLTCLVCPRGCRLTVDDNLKVSGNFCPRGIPYALQEIKTPKRGVTYAVKLLGEQTTLAVRSSAPLPKELMFEIVHILQGLKITRPIAFNEVLVQNILNTGIDIISSEEKL